MCPVVQKWCAFLRGEWREGGDARGDEEQGKRRSFAFYELAFMDCGMRD